MICFACPVGLCLGSGVAPVVVGLFLLQVPNLNVERCDDQPAPDPACCFDCPADPAPAEQ